MKSDAGQMIKNGRRRRLKLRRARWGAGNTSYNRKKAEADEKPTEISLQFCASSSSSSERSPENDVSAALREDSTRENLGQDVPAWTARVAVSLHGCISLIGRRREMEDAVRVELGFASRSPFGDRYDFFGVYDGHGGPDVAGECKERLHGIVKGLVEATEGHIDWADVMAESFAEMDAEVVRTGDEAVGTVGSTAVVAVVGREVVVVANCGDSRAVMSRGGTAIALSDDHKPNRPDELKRIEAAGGRIINWNGHRILGVLATSRSIGDQYLKPFVTPEPEVTVTERTHLDEFLILASDGLWDVVSNEDACQVVRQCLEAQVRRRLNRQVGAEGGCGAVVAASLLARLAMSRGSGDNISVIVVELNKRYRTPS